jgi:hypothetical protein
MPERLPEFFVDPNQRGVVRGGWFDESSGIIVGAHAQEVVDILNAHFQKPLPDLDLPPADASRTDREEENITAILNAIKANDMTVRAGVKGIMLINRWADE